jgi:alpha-L-arabinofuranosidase
MFARNVGDHVLPVTASGSGLYCSATIGTRNGRVFLKIVNPVGQSVACQLTFSGSEASQAGIEVLSDADPTVGDTLADPAAVTPSRATLSGSDGEFSYQAPANSLTVVTLITKSR